MNMTQISEIVTPILQHRFHDKGFRGTDVSSEEDFDGEIVLKVKARMDAPIEVMERVDAALEIKDALEQNGESRLVYLVVETGQSPEDAPDEGI